MAETNKVTIDGKEYDFNQFSEKAQQDFVSLQLVDRKIVEAQQQLAILQTARNAYARSLTDQLPKEHN